MGNVEEVEALLRNMKPPAPRGPECKNGHERTEENTKVYVNKHGHKQRNCLDCLADTKRRAKAAKLGSVHW